jgi:hypothetical protein
VRHWRCEPDNGGPWHCAAIEAICRTSRRSRPASPAERQYREQLNEAGHSPRLSRD